ncbi:hypothetical protein B0H99_11083 [Planomicrobium soli]|uniref:Inner-membrane translocator n=1 Tax=Planomicrobium soli TaxID=1176648 RepID=A0A2P8GG72_9BACL|nr:inner-membrane translocator [Planomicrobium soli]PSL32973.1 hypothetical protein B0H99_11083 [Planomicrobium soli]
MADFILVGFLIILITLNIFFFKLSKEEKLDLMVSGLILMALAPVVRVIISESLLHFVEWRPEDTREGAGYGGAMLALLIFINGVILLVIGFNRWLFTVIKKNRSH